MNDWLSSIGNWIEHHSAAAAWVQAIGATLAVATAVLVPALQARHARQQRDDDRQLRAKSLAIAIYPDLLHIRTIHRRIRSRLSQLTAHTNRARGLADAAIAGSDLANELKRLLVPVSDALRAMVPEFTCSANRSARRCSAASAAASSTMTS